MASLSEYKTVFFFSGTIFCYLKDKEPVQDSCVSNQGLNNY